MCIDDRITNVARSSANVSAGRQWHIRSVALVAVLALGAGASARAGDWPMFGQGLANGASNRSDVTRANVGSLSAKWVFTTGGDVSARAAVVDGAVYFPDWGGNLWAIRSNNGKALWSHQLSDYFGDHVHRNSRTTPAVVKGVLYTATQEGAWLLAINAGNGKLLWKTQLESDDPFAIISSSPAVAAGVVFTGVASTEEAAVAPAPFGGNYPCCHARGSAVAVDAATGAILWKTYTVPPGYSGVSVWGSNPIVDVARNSVFIGTGNNFGHPTDPLYQACIAVPGATEASCLSPDDHVDSILALDMTTGAIKWSQRLMVWNQPYLGIVDGSDSWNVACFFGPVPNCPASAGPDYDFGSGPNEITYQTSSGTRTIIGAGQKSGIYYALDPDLGTLLWSTQVGPGSAFGGIEWGSASDGMRIYVAIANFYRLPNNAGGAAGSWAALDPATGAILWQVPDPNGDMDLGPLAVSNGIVYAPSMSSAPGAPTMLALDAATGATLWSFAAGSSVNCGATIVDGTVFWGSGYSHVPLPGFSGNNKFYAFR